MTPVIAGLSLNPIARPVADALAGIYSVIPNYGVAIMLLALGWMILIAPLTLKTTRSMLAMQRLQPQLKRLQEQHKNDRQALSQATMDLYREEGVSPFGSCLPTLLPLPVFFALFRVIDGLSQIDKATGLAAPRYLSHTTQMYKDIVAAHGKLIFFGDVNLANNVFSKCNVGIGGVAPYVVLLLIMMGTQYWQTVSMMNRNPANANNPQAQIMKYLPLIFGVVCVRFPAGVIVYYATSNLCRIAQQSLMYRFDPKVRELAVRDAQVIDAEARDIESGKLPRTKQAAPEAPKTRFRDLLNNAAAQQEARRTNGPAKGGATANGSGKRPSPSSPAKRSDDSRPTGPKAAPGAQGGADQQPRSRTGAGPRRTGANSNRTKKRRGR